MAAIEHFLVDNHAGWRLSLGRMKTRPEPIGRPALVIPGYGMNSYIFGFHPKGPSMLETLANRGLEVWTIDFRGQGRSIRARGTNRYSMGDLAVDDLGTAIRFILANTATKATTVDLLGCSLGTALAFAHVACVPEAPVGALVSMAGLVTWRAMHPVVKLAFGSPRLAGLMRMKNTRRLVRMGLPVIAAVAPSMLSIYLNTKSSDVSQSARLAQTVEDPHPIINREISEWMKRGDLVVRGVNVSAKLPELKNPFLCVVAANDGIVLPETSRHTYDVIGSNEKKLLVIGDSEQPIAHADLFVCTGAQTRVFAPIADFLTTV